MSGASPLCLASSIWLTHVGFLVPCKIFLIFKTSRVTWVRMFLLPVISCLLRYTSLLLVIAFMCQGQLKCPFLPEIFLSARFRILDTILSQFEFHIYTKFTYFLHKIKISLRAITMFNYFLITFLMSCPMKDKIY